MSRSDIARRVRFFEKDLKRPNNLYPLEPKIMKAHEVLAWISAFSQQRGGEEQSIGIESFAYTMVKRPDPRRPGERYTVKVDLEFRSAPELAKELQDTLLDPRSSIAKAGEDVKWHSSGGLYSTSFTLRDQTLY